MIALGSMATWTQDDIDTLKAAVRSGVLTVSFSGPPSRSITYQSLDAMRSLLAEMEGSVASAAGATRYRRVRVLRGFRDGARGSFRRNE